MIAHQLVHARFSLKPAGLLALALFFCHDSRAPGAESAGKIDSSKPSGNGRSAAVLLQQALTAAKATSDADGPLERADIRGVPAKTPADAPGLLPSPDAFPDDAQAAATPARNPLVPAATNKAAPAARRMVQVSSRVTTNAQHRTTTMTIAARIFDRRATRCGPNVSPLLPSLFSIVQPIP